MLGTTPMFVQYDQIKKDYDDCILFYRLGDFYEMFGPDAITASRVLGVALTARDGGGGSKVPMCGVPFHAADNYLAKLVQNGYKVAVCEQTEDPKSVKGLVKREVIRVVTPGMILDDAFLDKHSNHIVALCKQKNTYGFAVADTSTGLFLATSLEDDTAVLNELARRSPVEIILSNDDVDLKDTLLSGTHTIINTHLPFAFEPPNAEKILCDHFDVHSLNGYGYLAGVHLPALSAAGGLMHYIYTMQKHKPLNMTAMQFYDIKNTMILDAATRNNLELVAPIGAQDKRYCLLGILDDTVTAAGSRMLRAWLESPLNKKEAVQARLDATDELYHDNGMRLALRSALKDIFDIERIVSRISYGTANARDLLSLKKSLQPLPEIATRLQQLQAPLFQTLQASFDTLQDVYALLEKTIDDQAPFSLREGQLIRPGCHEELDELLSILGEGNHWMASFEAKEKERTGIKTLKIGFNKVFGYYIDVTKSYLSMVPEDYQRKQTLANSERYITAELKHMEDKVLSAGERRKQLEYELFVALRTSLQEEVPRCLSTSSVLATIDVFTTFAEVALQHNYVKPKITEDAYDIAGLRHPVVEQTLHDRWYVPNAIHFDRDTQRFIVLTGPNMSGKSTYCRSIALAAIMMQIGSFVPADNAAMRVSDRVFARIGASDMLSAGQSTFMVEMTEVANILHHATLDSLIILDEVGRGTSTYDGVSIAHAISRYINDKIGAFTIFATHYHELIGLDSDPGIRNFSVATQEEGERIVFLHTIVPEPASKSYGIHVAEMAGLPEYVVAAAEQLLRVLEAHDKTEDRQLGLADTLLERLDRMEKKSDDYEALILALANTDLQAMTIGDAFNHVQALQEQAQALLNLS